MKLKMKTSLPGTIIGAALTAAGIIGAILFQGAAIEESATNSARFRYVLFLLAALIGFVILAVTVQSPCGNPGKSMLSSKCRTYYTPDKNAPVLIL